MPSNKIISGIVLKKRKEQESNPWSVSAYFTVKTTLAFVNILIVVIGITIVSIGSQILNIFTFGLPLEVSRTSVILGALIICIGAIGIYGVFSEKGMYLGTYIGLITLAMLIKITCIIIISTNSSVIDSYFVQLFKSTSPADVANVDKIQNAFECCGTTDCKYSDPCWPKLQSAFSKLVIPLGIAIGVEGLIIIICLLYLSHLVRKSTISQSEIRDAWKQNNESIQKDYSKFVYVIQDFRCHSLRELVQYPLTRRHSGPLEIAGLILISGGGMITSSSASDILNLSGSIGISAIVIGVIITIVSFLGCFGAANEKGMLLKTYFGLLIILVILETSVGIAAYAKMDDLDILLGNSWIDSYKQNTTVSLNTLRGIERSLNCCGYNSTTDYTVPLGANISCTESLGTQSSCREILFDKFNDSLNTLGVAGITIGIFELIGLVFSIILFRRIAAKENIHSSLLNESWRINKNKIQYGYQRYQYV